ncbi:MAG: glycosyltransferase family 4 protein [Desulfovibrionaceae bacterium]|nr:glycosyltransferase family 4 protein [Desulfovibrionaceae bacterium]
MKVLVLGNQARSVANFWSVLMRKLRGKGHEVLCGVPHGTLEEEQKLSQVSSGLKFFNIARKSLNPLQDLRTYLDLERIFREERPDIIFTTTIKPVIYGCLAARRCKIKCYATITGLGYTFEADSFFKRIIKAISVRLYRLALSSAEGIFFQNLDDLAVFRANSILAPKVKVFMAKGTGVDTKHFAASPLPPLPPKNPLKVLFVGRLLAAKGLRELAEASALLRPKYSNFSLQILGPEEPGLGGIPLNEVRAWESRGLLTYLGATQDVRPYLKDCHLLVLPSYREGTPTAVMEAMSCGRMCIVTDVPGCKEVVVNGYNGLLVPAKNPKALAQALEDCLIDPSKIIEMGQNSRKLAEQDFDAEVVANKIMADMQL